MHKGLTATAKRLEDELSQLLCILEWIEDGQDLLSVVRNQCGLSLDLTIDVEQRVFCFAGKGKVLNFKVPLDSLVTEHFIVDLGIKSDNLNINDDSNSINIMIYPTKKKMKISLNNENNYIIGGEIYKLKQNKKYVINRLTSKNKQDTLNSNILVKCIDDNKDSKIVAVNQEQLYLSNIERIFVISSFVYVLLLIRSIILADILISRSIMDILAEWSPSFLDSQKCKWLLKHILALAVNFLYSLY